MKDIINIKLPRMSDGYGGCVPTVHHHMNGFGCIDPKPALPGELEGLLNEATAMLAEAKRLIGKTVVDVRQTVTSTDNMGVNVVEFVTGDGQKKEVKVRNGAQGYPGKDADIAGCNAAIENAVEAAKKAKEAVTLAEQEIGRLKTTIVDADKDMEQIRGTIRFAEAAMKEFETKVAAIEEAEGLRAVAENGRVEGFKELSGAVIESLGKIDEAIKDAIDSTHQIGDAISQIVGFEIPIRDGYYIYSDTNVLSGKYTKSDGYQCAYYNVKPGDYLIITGEGGAVGLLWAFADAENKYMTPKASRKEKRENWRLDVPEGASIVALNSRPGVDLVAIYYKANSAENKVNDVVDKAKAVTRSANEAAGLANTAAVNANDGADAANGAVSAAGTAINNANAAAKRAEDAAVEAEKLSGQVINDFAKEQEKINAAVTKAQSDVATEVAKVQPAIAAIPAAVEAAMQPIRDDLVGINTILNGVLYGND